MKSWFRSRRDRDRYDSWIYSKPEFAKKNRGEQFSLSMIDLWLFASCDYGCYDGILRDGAQPSYFFIFDGAAQ
jgi:hypothetical protein